MTLGFVSVHDILMQKGNIWSELPHMFREEWQSRQSKLLQGKAFHKLNLLCSTSPLTGVAFAFLYVVLVCLVATCESGDIYMK